MQGWLTDKEDRQEGEYVIEMERLNKYHEVLKTKLIEETAAAKAKICQKF